MTRGNLDHYSVGSDEIEYEIMDGWIIQEILQMIRLFIFPESRTVNDTF